MGYYILHKYFNTKKEGENYVRKYIRNLWNKNVEKYIFPEHKEYKFLCALMMVEPNFFLLGTNESGHPHLCYSINGEVISKSWVKASRRNFKPTPYKEKLDDALRFVVREDVNKFRREHKGEPCAWCCSKERPQVDHHHISFSNLKQNFLDSYKGSVPQDFTKEGYRHVLKSVDYGFGNAFKEYHNQKATYQILCAPCNLKKGNKTFF